MPKRKAYAVRDKLAAITQVKQGQSQARVSREYGVPESTLRGWLKDESKLRDFVHTVDESDGMDRKRARTAENPTLDSAMYTWFVQEQRSGVPLSGPVVKAQAQKFSQELQPDTDFVASQGWLWRFQKRHAISQVKITREKRSADMEAANGFPQQLKEYLEDNGLSDDQVYNCDETGLFPKMLPDRTLAVKSEKDKSAGFKQQKDRITLLFCCNRTGSQKLKLLCIGKSRSPRCLHHVNMATMPVQYTNSKNAWMTATIFEEWFQKSFVPAVRKHLRSLKMEEKAVLLLDNCPAHPPADMLESRDGKIKVLYLPPNTTSKIQPLDQGIISSFKKIYRRELVKELVVSESGVTGFLKSMTLKDTFYLASRAWDSVTPLTIANCWKEGLGEAFSEKTGHDSESCDDSNDFLGFSAEEIAEAEGKLRAQMDSDQSLENFLDEWSEIDKDVETEKRLSEEEIIQDATQPASDTDDLQEEADAAPPPPPPPSASEAVDAFSTALRWLESQSDVETMKVLQVRNLLHMAKKKQHQGMCQKKLTDFFSKK